MAARQLIVPGAMPARDENGRVLPSKFRFYLPGTTTPAVVYTASDLATPHAFPILSDSAGRWPAMWADEDDSFNVGWTDQIYDQTIDTFANVSPADDAVLASVEMAEAAADDAEIFAAEAAASALAAAASASGLDVVATSASPVTVGTGSKSWTLDQTGKDFAIGMDVIVADSVTPGNRMVGTITGFADPLLTVSVASSTGSGSHSAWSISLTSIGGVLSMAGLTGIITAAAAKAALAIASTDITNFADAVADEAIALAVAF